MIARLWLLIRDMVTDSPLSSSQVWRQAREKESNERARALD